MVFVADALGTWLVEQLADACRKKLTELVLGSEQERALRRAADAAVWATAEEVSPSGTRQPGQVAMVIGEVFRNPTPAAPPAGPVMLLQGLQAAIAGQLAVLDDAELTETGESSADALGVPGTVLADRLAGHLVREIIVRGSGGGPLKPLADQFNHELTRLQIGGMLTWLAGEIRDALAHPGTDITAAGRPLEEVTDPFAFEVHRPVQPEDAPTGLPPLPPYVRREHDQALGQVVHAAAGGHSGIAVLVGGSSVGKTRACWEALALLRGQDPPWRLWHPIDPSRPDAALAGLAGIGPRTVVWLNEAQFYLDAEAGLGERVAAGVRELLRDPARAPVLVLATLWPRYWDTLTSRPGGSEDRRAQARELLAGHDITVPDAFTPAQMGQLAQVADARMTLAARSASDGAVTQFLAGAPELLTRYRNAPPAVAALIDAAMDARRLGMGPGLPEAFLEAAAGGYLTDAEWDELGEDWLQQALAYAAVSCKGVRGPLTRIRPRPASRIARGRGDRHDGIAPDAGPQYRLADYLDQHGRAHRTRQVPPAEFWSAAAVHAAPRDQATLGDAAHARGLYRHAAQLHKNAAPSGGIRTALYLSDPPACLRADPHLAYWAAAHASFANAPYAGILLLDRLRRAGADEQAAALALRAAAHAPLDDTAAVASLLDHLRKAGADEQAATLASRAAAHAHLESPAAVARLLDHLRKAGADEQAATLASRAAAHAPLDSPAAVASLLDHLRKAGADEQAAMLLARDPAAHASLDEPDGVARLLDSLRKADADEQAATLASRAADHAHLYKPFALVDLLSRFWMAGAHEQAAALADRIAVIGEPYSVRAGLDCLREAGADEQAAALASRAAAHASLDDPYEVSYLLNRLREAGADEQAAALLARDPAAHASLTRAGTVGLLLDSLREAGADEQAAALASRAAAHAPLDNPDAVALLLKNLREAGADEQAAALASRAAAHAPLDDPAAVASLLDSLRKAGADEQTAALLARDPAAHARLDKPGAVARLLDSLRKAGADEQTAALLARDPAAHASLGNPIRTDRLPGSLRQAHREAAILLGSQALTRLLDSLREAGADEQAAALASRVAAQAPLDDPLRAATLLEFLREAGADEQAAALVDRLPAVGLFELFLKQNGLVDQFRFGREADGTPAAPWSWLDLDLSLVPQTTREGKTAAGRLLRVDGLIG